MIEAGHPTPLISDTLGVLYALLHANYLHTSADANYNAMLRSLEAPASTELMRGR
jgi:hypothetical protein